MRRCFLLLSLGLVYLSGCSTHTVKTTAYTPIVQDSQNINEDFLLDVGVAIFDPGIDELDDDQEQLTNHQVRLAESRYAPYLLSETLQRSANWGIVRLMPNANSGCRIIFIDTIGYQNDGRNRVIGLAVVGNPLQTIAFFFLDTNCLDV